MHTSISFKTIAFVAIFALGYLFFTTRKTARQQLDLYDLVMLSAVAIVPFVFVAVPGVAYWLSDIAGVEFPFVVMFGILFAILFVFVHRLTAALHRLESDNRQLIQEIGLLKQAMEETAAERESDHAGK